MLTSFLCRQHRSVKDFYLRPGGRGIKVFPLKSYIKLIMSSPTPAAVPTSAPAPNWTDSFPMGYLQMLLTQLLAMVQSMMTNLLSIGGGDEASRGVKGGRRE